MMDRFSEDTIQYTNRLLLCPQDDSVFRCLSREREHTANEPLLLMVASGDISIKDGGKKGLAKF